MDTVGVSVAVVVDVIEDVDVAGLENGNDYGCDHGDGYVNGDVRERACGAAATQHPHQYGGRIRIPSLPCMSRNGFPSSRGR